MCNWYATCHRAHCAMIVEMPGALSVFRVDEKVAVVVGAASGIGEATAVALSESGAMVVCADVDLAGAEATASRMSRGGRKATALMLDITDPKRSDPASAQS